MPRRLALVAAALAALLAPAGAVEFKPYRAGSFAELRKAHPGRPLAVHYWSVTCPACLAELPDWAKLAREKKAIDVVFVNTDQETDRKRAEARLDKAGLTEAAHFGFAEDFAEKLYFEVDHDWRGELPFTALLGADGKLETVTGALDDPQMVAWLAKARN